MITNNMHGAKLYSYTNGNYIVDIYADGTKIRTLENDDEDFEPEYPENIDIKITDRCDAGCDYCHEGSSSVGKHYNSDIFDLLKTAHQGMELAIGGGNVLDVRQANAMHLFMSKVSNMNLVPNITVNQIHLMREPNSFTVISEYAYGKGISMITPTDSFIKKVKMIPNAVIHVIAGVVTLDDLKKLSGKGLKILILGYKQFRRGDDYYFKHKDTIEKNQKDLKENLKNIFSWFRTISFDNLALAQLDVESAVDQDVWNTSYMGDDGKFTFYIDAVKMTFAMNSTVPVEKRHAITAGMTIKEMFEIIKKDRI